jgi:hypothetical protein
MSADNPLWGALRIHGELLKLGFEVAQSSVDPARGAHHIGAHPLRTSSPLLQNLIFGTDKAQSEVDEHEP